MADSGREPEIPSCRRQSKNVVFNAGKCYKL